MNRLGRIKSQAVAARLTTLGTVLRAAAGISVLLSLDEQYAFNFSSKLKDDLNFQNTPPSRPSLLLPDSFIGRLTHLKEDAQSMGNLQKRGEVEMRRRRILVQNLFSLTRLVYFHLMHSILRSTLLMDDAQIVGNI